MTNILHIKKVLFSLLIAFGLNSCSLFPNGNENGTERYFSLAKIPNQMVGQIQLEKFEFVGVVERSMLVQSEITSTHVNLVAMTFEGVPIIQASWLALDNTWQVITGLSLMLEPSQILHDLQSVHWPLSVIEDVLHKSYSVIEETSSFGFRTRKFYFNDVLIRTIDYKEDMIEFNDFKKNYQLKITPLNS